MRCVTTGNRCYAAEKETGRRRWPPCDHEKFNVLKRETRARPALTAQQKAKQMTGSALELIEKIDGACCEHAEQRHTHCHCEIHKAS
jgi:hypothetical protein